MDEPTTFDYDGKEYPPNNYGEVHGKVPIREASPVDQCRHVSWTRWWYTRERTWRTNSVGPSIARRFGRPRRI